MRQAILQYMKDNSVEFRILEEPLLVTGLGIAFAKNDSRGLDQPAERCLLRRCAQTARWSRSLAELS